MTDDVAGRLGGQEEIARAAEADAVTVLARDPAYEAARPDPLPEAVHANAQPADEASAPFDRRDVAVGCWYEQRELELRRELVLAALACHLDRVAAATAAGARCSARPRRPRAGTVVAP